MDNELEQLGERIAEHAAHLDAAMHRLLTDIREFDQRGGWYKQGALSCAHWLSWRVGWTLGTARDHVRVAGKLEGLPTIDDALRRGEVSYSKVRAMVRVATPENESLLLDHARLLTGAQLETTCRKLALVERHGEDPHPLGDLQRRYVRRRDTEDGMVKIEAVLHPEEAELVWTMLTHAATQLTREPGSSTCHDSAQTHASVLAHSTACVAPHQPGALRRPKPEQSGVPRFVGISAGPRDGSTAASDLAPACLSPCVGTSSCQSDYPAGAPAPIAVALARFASISAGQRDSSAEASELAPACLSQCMNTSACQSDVGALTSVELERAMASTPPAARTAMCQIALSAETPRLVAKGQATSTPSLQRAATSFVDDGTTTGASNDSTEVPDERSLLERRLDEADALREVETAATDDRGTVWSQDDQHEPEPDRQASVLRQRSDATRRAFDRADALVTVAQGYLRGDRPNRSPVEILLTIPASSLRAGKGDPVEVGVMGDSFVSREAARRLSCDAGVVEIVEDEHGTPLSVGRKRRTMSGSLKRALHQRDKTCAYPGCTNRLFLEGHHIKHWADGGETSLMNGILLCTQHHHFVHEHRYTIELGPDQRPQFRDPHGRLIAPVPARPVTADLGWPHIRVANEPLAMSAETPACGWDGSAPDYGTIVGHLLAANGPRSSAGRSARRQ